jgi:hypothetical protein
MNCPSILTLQTNKPRIAIFASGHSILDIPLEEIKEIKEIAFTLFMNYAQCHFNEEHMDALIFSDKVVGGFLNINLQEKPKYALIAREQAFHKFTPAKIYNWMSYYFDHRKDGVYGNYTLVWALQYMQKIFPTKPIMLFGMDKGTKGLGKWYDKFTQHDTKRRPPNTHSQMQKLNECAQQVDKWVNKSTVYNCNASSGYNGFLKMNWRDIKIV